MHGHFSARIRTRSPRFAKPKQGMASMAWHWMVECVFALSLCPILKAIYLRK